MIGKAHLGKYQLASPLELNCMGIIVGIDGISIINAITAIGIIKISQSFNFILYLFILI